MRIVRGIFRAIGIALAALLALLLIWAGVHQLMSRTETYDAQRLGDTVEVRGGCMNVYALGDGETTVVLMPGLGTAAPALDFEPLAQRLSKEYRVVTVEPFGYGWSDLTDDERSAENIVEELREALSAAGETGPYVLMAHSVSGIYALWYADSYPDEVAAIIGLDCTLPRQTEYFGGSYPTVPEIAKLACPMGLCRLLCMASPAAFVSDNSAGLYSEDNLLMQKKLASKNGYNRNVIDELNATTENAAATGDLEFDEKLPLLFITRTESSHTPRADGKTSRSFYETYITAPDRQFIAELEAGHYMHWTRCDEIAEAVSDFLADVQ